MKLLAVTSCPTGVAHTYMAAEQLQKTAARLGVEIQVETQGAMGVENGITAGDLEGAQAVIIAAGIPISGRERFSGLRIVEVTVQEAIRLPEACLKKALE